MTPSADHVFARIRYGFYVWIAVLTVVGGGYAVHETVGLVFVLRMTGIVIAAFVTAFVGLYLGGVLVADVPGSVWRWLTS